MGRAEFSNSDRTFTQSTQADSPPMLEDNVIMNITIANTGNALSSMGNNPSNQANGEGYTHALDDESPG